MLTETEKRLLRLKKQGLTGREIAKITRFSEGTVRVYFSKIYKKLELRSINMLTITKALENQ